MSEHDELDATAPENDNADEADVEAHGLKEVAVTGLSAAAMIVGAGDALAANAPEHASANAKQAVHKVDSRQAILKRAATIKESANKSPTLKADAAWKWSLSKEAFDPSSRRGRDAS